MRLIGTVAIILVASLCVTGFAGVHRPGGADDILGTWLTGDKEAKVTIFKAGSTYYGKIAWLKQPLTESGEIKKDEKNSNKTLQDKPLVNLLILKSFEYSEADEVWQSGTLYDPKSGKTFSCKMELSNAKTLQVRAFIGIAITGKTDTWTKVE